MHIDCEWVGQGASTIVFLHEGLGSIAMWRGFPSELSSALAMRGLVYSRPGYGRSTPRAHAQRWKPDYLHRQAYDVLPKLLDDLGLREPVWLYGHSDGGSIALLFAARFPGRTAGAIVAAPHWFVEDMAIEGIRRTRTAYLEGGLRERLARFHDDVDSAFYGWHDIWTDPAFRSWNIADDIALIAAPVLAIQGIGDEYGTLEQVRGIARLVKHAKVLELAGCGHSPHRDQARAVIEASVEFVRSRR